MVILAGIKHTKTWWLCQFKPVQVWVAVIPPSWFNISGILLLNSFAVFTVFHEASDKIQKNDPAEDWWKGFDCRWINPKAAQRAAAWEFVLRWKEEKLNDRRGSLASSCKMTFIIQIWLLTTMKVCKVPLLHKKKNKHSLAMLFPSLISYIWYLNIL